MSAATTSSFTPFIALSIRMTAGATTRTTGRGSRGSLDAS